MAILDPQDSMIPSRKLNLVNDPSPGQLLSTANVSGSIIQPYYGQLGKRLVCTPAMAAKLQDTTIGYLYEGIYQYVQVAAGLTVARGQIAYWSNYNNFVVTNNPVPSSWAVNSQIQGNPGYGTASGGPLPPPVAGIFLSAPTAGNYCYIQISGRATVLFKTLITNGNGGIFRAVTADGVSSATADILNAASPTNMNLAQLILGITLNTPSNGGFGLVDLWNTRQVMGGFGGF